MAGLQGRRWEGLQGRSWEELACVEGWGGGQWRTAGGCGAPAGSTRSDEGVMHPYGRVALAAHKVILAGRTPLHVAWSPLLPTAPGHPPSDAALPPSTSTCTSFPLIIRMPTLQCLEPGQQPRFPPTTAGAHLLERYNATHAGWALTNIACWVGCCFSKLRVVLGWAHCTPFETDSGTPFLFVPSNCIC